MTRFLRTRDDTNRVWCPHGVSFSSSTKVPQLQGDGFFDHANVSFVGRPVQLATAKEHLERLVWLGFDFVRLVIPWEAVEHKGPGIYDEEYIAYLDSLLDLFHSYGIRAYIDVHQDVWSRYSGGSGAPGWTFDLAGLDIKNFKETGAAFVESQNETKADIWPSGYQKFAAATMFTLFFASRTLAPSLEIPKNKHANPSIFQSTSDNIPIQDFLQKSLIAAFSHLVRNLHPHLENGTIIGIGPLNEPHRGYIDLHSPNAWDYNTDLHIGAYPNALQGMRLAAGENVTVPFYTRSWPFPTRQTGTVSLNASKMRAWKEGSEDVWKSQGVWEGNKWLREEFFQVDWYNSCWWPYCREFEKGIKAAWCDGSEPYIFCGGVPNEFYPPTEKSQLPDNLIAAPHFYDLDVLFSKKLGMTTVNVQGLSRGMFILKAIYFGASGIKRNYALQVKNFVQAALKNLGEYPVIVAESGVPMDINFGSAFRDGDFKWQERMMDALLSAMESNNVPCCLWNYNPYNTDAKGDEWNQENFSFWSQSAVKPLPSDASSEQQMLNGLRLVDAIQRPRATKVAGIPVSTLYDKDTRAFTFSFRNPYLSSNVEGKEDKSLTFPFPIRSKVTEIFLPDRVYANSGFSVRLTDGTWEWNSNTQRVLYTHENEQEGFEHAIYVDVNEITSKTHTTRYLGWIQALAVLVLSLLLGNFVVFRSFTFNS